MSCDRSICFGPWLFYREAKESLLIMSLIRDRAAGSVPVWHMCKQRSAVYPAAADRYLIT